VLANPVVVDRIVVRDGIEGRLADSFEQALKLADGLAYIDPADAHVIETKAKAGEYEPEGRITFSQKFACPVSGFTISEIEPRLFSFNAPQGACPACGVAYEGREGGKHPYITLALMEEEALALTLRLGVAKRDRVGEEDVEGVTETDEESVVDIDEVADVDSEALPLSVEDSAIEGDAEGVGEADGVADGLPRQPAGAQPAGGTR
jgi:hypothetical protein